jgi:hypothetical protein
MLRRRPIQCQQATDLVNAAYPDGIMLFGFKPPILISPPSVLVPLMPSSIKFAVDYDALRNSRMIVRRK